MDMYCSIAVLVGISGSLFGMKSLDKAAAIAAMILLVSAGFEILSSSVHDLRHPDEAKNGEHHHMHLNKKIILPTAGFFALAYVFSGFYIVKIDQSAIVKRFGKITKPHVESGLHYKLPFPFEEVLIIESDRIRTVNTGVQELLTGDTNLVKVATSVHYKIKSQLNYVVNIADAENLINSATLSSIRAVAGKTELDYLLTRGKEDIEKKVQKILQQKLDELKSGIEVVNVQLPLVEPPDPVKEKFNDLASARQDKSIYVHEALGYKNSILPKASGDAYTMVAEAESYKADKINTAIGDAKLFEEQVTSVKGSKSVTKFRMYMETMDKILPDVEKILLAGNVKINRAELWLKNSNTFKDGE
jgi:membrane protease subunit HflK